MVLVAAMVPKPGEPPAQWWANTGFDSRPFDGGFDVMKTFFHDVPADVVAEAMARGERNFFPAAFMRRVVRERLGITPDEMDSGHLPAFSHPRELAERLHAYATE